ncbi:hypothetical protein XcodCFBP4690_02980 [Xanthomonas codiaei]|uniref:Uncharacterized protein n=1 Tax=Xanthomonas codiaei TaxID=56463 RepID=A0A2S7CWN0_9XANT|nr:hypothetical protein XcodCFBP4690_02980 [Xanthomonas codiaei]
MIEASRTTDAEARIAFQRHCRAPRQAPPSRACATRPAWRLQPIAACHRCGRARRPLRARQRAAV